MAGSIIKIKRSVANGAPGSLEYGELAYSGKSDTHKLYIGMYGTGGDSNNVLVTPIGGKFYTDLLSATPGTLTASKALIVDSDSKLDQFKIDDLFFNNNVVSTSTSNTNLQLNANGTGKIQFYDSSNSYTFPRRRGDAGQVLTIGSGGDADWADVAVDLGIQSNNGDGTVNLLNDPLKFTGMSGIDTAFNDTTNTLEIYGVHASSSAIGVASFEANDFDIDTAAHVSLKKERIQDYVGEMIDNGIKTNMTAVYNDDSNRLEFAVNIASTSQKGIAQFNSSHFTFPTEGNVSLKDDILQTITVPSGTVTISSNTLVLADGTGISISGTGSNTLTIAAVKATSTVFGVAKFAESYFDMGTPGVVKINAATEGANKGAASVGLASFNSVNFSVDTGYVTAEPIMLGDTSLALGDTVASLSGLTSLAAAHFTFITNEIKGTVTDEDIKITPLGTGKVKISDTWYLPRVDGLIDQVLTANGDGTTSWKSPKSDIIIYGDATDETLTIGVGNLKFIGGDGLDTSVATNGDNVEVTVKGTLATTSDYGVAKYFADEFDLSTAGTVNLKANGIANAKLANKTIGIGATSIELGGSATVFTGITSTEISNLKIGGSGGDLPNTIASRTENGNIYLSPDKTSALTPGRVKISDAFFLPAVDGTNGQVMITDGAGNITWDTPAVSLDVAAGTGSGTIDLLTETLTIGNGVGITTSFDGPSNTFTIDAVLANNSGRVGVASYTGSQFDVSVLGVVSLADGGVTNAKLANSSITIGDTAVSLGSTITTLTALTGVTTGNLEIGATGSANTIRAVNSGLDGDILLRTKGAGDITFFSGSAYSYSLPKTRGTDNYVLTTRANGTTEWAQPVSTISIADEHSGADTINLNGGVLLFKDGVGTTVSIGSDSVTIDADIATTSTVGVAKFDPSQFEVSLAGNVTLLDTGINDIVGNMIGTTNNITVTYSDHNLDFSVATATADVLGVARFSTGDFVVTGGNVSLDGTVLQSITTDSGSAAPGSNALSIIGDGVINVSATDTSEITIGVDVATASTLGVASFPTTYFGISSGVVSINDASTSAKGVASFADDHFTVTSGGVSIKTQTLGDKTIIAGGPAITAINGLTQVTSGKLVISGYEIAYNTADAATDGDISLNPKGQGVVSVGGARITNVGTPTNDTDAANKAYVDAAKAGLTIKDPVRVASTADINLSYTGATPPVVDTIPLNSGDRVLVKNQNQVANEQATDDPENGIWVWTLTGGSSAWARAADADTGPEMVAGMFMFVQEGDTQADTGWVLGTDATVTINSTSLKFVQFSAAGTIQVASDGGLKKSGQVLSIKLPETDSALEIDGSNNLVVAQTFAGAGLTLTNGVLDVVGTTNRITVNADSIDISTSYVGQASITTVGTISSGTWNGNTISAAHGGTGVTTANNGDLLVGNGTGWSKKALGAAYKILQVNAAGDDLVYGDIDGGEY